MIYLYIVFSYPELYTQEPLPRTETQWLRLSEHCTGAFMTFEFPALLYGLFTKQNKATSLWKNVHNFWRFSGHLEFPC